MTALSEYFLSSVLSYADWFGFLHYYLLEITKNVCILKMFTVFNVQFIFIISSVWYTSFLRMILLSAPLHKKKTLNEFTASVVNLISKVCMINFKIIFNRVNQIKWGVARHNCLPFFFRTGKKNLAYSLFFRSTFWRKHSV